MGYVKSKKKPFWIAVPVQMYNANIKINMTVMNSSPLNNIKICLHVKKQWKEEKKCLPYSRMPTNKHRNNNKVTKLSLQNFQKLIQKIKLNLKKYHSGLLSLLSESLEKQNISIASNYFPNNLSITQQVALQ